MKTTFNFVLGAALALGLAACSSTTTSSSPSEVDEPTAKAKAAQIVPGGTVGEASKIDDAEEHRWAVTVKLANGAEVSVEIERATGELMEIAGEKGPFDYDLPAPVSGFMTYAQARTKALATKTGGVEAWEVKTDTKIYEFYVRETATTKLFEIKMDAASGNVASVVEKDKPD